MGSRSDQRENRISELEDRAIVRGELGRNILKTREHGEWIQ